MRHNLYKCMITLVIILIVMANVKSQTFTSSGAITINNGANVAASPYPSTINISGLSGSITKLTVTVSGFNNLTPRDVDMLLVGPGGQSFIFCSDAGGTADAVNLTITFDDAAATALPQSTLLSSGTFKPTNYDVTEDVFSLPAPTGPYNNAPPFGAGTLALFNGTNPNGTWNLYVVEDAGDAANGSIGSWSLTFTLATPPNVLVTINQSEGQSDPAITGPINFTVIFSEAVTGFTSSDVTLGGTAGATTAVVTEIAPNNGTTYNVAVSGMSTGGTVIVGIPAGAAVNAANIFNNAATSTDNTVTYSPPVSVAPTVTINQAAGQSDPTSNSPINFTVTFNQAVTGFTPSDISFTGSTPLIFISPVVTVTGGPSIYNVAVSGMRSSGIVVASIPGGVALNAANQSNSASTSTDNSVLYNIPPCTLTCPQNITVGATSLSGTVVNYTVTPAGDCQNIASIPAPTTTFPVGTTTVNAYHNVSSGLVYGLIRGVDLVSGVAFDQLATFNVNTAGPTTLSNPITITGVTGELKAIDFRPSNGQLYGLGVIWFPSASPHYIGKIYAIDKNTGAATALSTDYFDLSAAGSLDIDFNPVTDVLRVTDANGTNLRIDPNLGTVIATDPALSAGFSGTAYTNSFPSSTFTTLYAINSSTDALYIQGGINGVPSPNTGLTTLVGPLGIDVEREITGFGGFDISLSAGALATFLVEGGFSLYSINLNSGAATLIGAFTGANGNFIDIAIAPITLPPPSCSFTVTVTPPPPTVTINKASTQPDPTFAAPIRFIVVFSEDVTGFDAADISFAGSTVSGTLVANITGSGTTYDVSVSGITSTGNVVASVPAGAATNSSNVANLASTSTDNIVAVAVVGHDLMISKTPAAPTILAGGVISYLISLSYPGGPVLPNVTITDILPPGTRFLSIQAITSLPGPSPSIFTPIPGQNGTITIVFPFLVPAPPRTFLVRVGVENNVSGNLNNTASVNTYLGDINPSNNSSTATVQVIQPITITCPSNVAVSTGAANCVGAVDLGNLNYVITGPSPMLTLSWRPDDDPAATLTSTVIVPGTSTPANFPTGVTTVTATVSNGTAPNASCQFTVTVVDNTPPTINCPGPQTLYTDANSCSIKLPDYRNLASDNCGLNTVVQTPVVGYEFQPGTYNISVVAVDQQGSFTKCEIAITVVDTIPPAITCPSNKMVNAEPGECYALAANVSLGLPVISDPCPLVRGLIPRRSDGQPLNANYPAGITTITWKASDVYGNTSTCAQTVTVIDDQPPVIANASANPYMLWPPNHKMKDVEVRYSSSDNCGVVTCRLEVSSNEPINGTGDGDTSPDWEVIDDHHVRLRAERAANGDGRIYTITIICADEQGNQTRESVEVRVAHNITAPHSGQSFKVGSTVAFAGTFWDKPGNKHTAKWVIDGTTTTGIVTEPSGNKNGKVTGSYKFNTPGVYKLQMNVTDQTGVTSYANTNGDLEAIVVIYDPNGGYTYGGGWYESPAGALVGNPSTNGKASYGFTMNYFKNATNPKGETQFELKVGSFEFNALNFDYLVISNSMAQFKGTGKIIGGQSGVGFIMTVVDGELDGTGIDKIRMKIYNKNNGKIIYDNQPGASDAALPVHAVGTNSIVVISGSNSSLTSANTNQKAEMEAGAIEVSDDLAVKVFPNPSASNFTINIKGNNKAEKIIMQVVDMYGRLIETRSIYPHSIIKFGDRYTPGSYFVRVRQGRHQKEIKLIKLSD